MYDEWIDQLSDWMKSKDLEAQVACEADSLIQASDHLQSAYEHLLGIVEHVDR